MRLAAYLIAGTPAWSAQSVASYYDIVDRIVVCCDAEERSWTGAPLDVDGTIVRILGMDHRGKIDLLHGSWSSLDMAPNGREAALRREALEYAGKGADWVLQLDSDQIALSDGRLERTIAAADAGGYAAVEYPVRRVYQRALNGMIVESATRWGGPRATFPGPVAVRTGSVPPAGRVSPATIYRVDFSASGGNSTAAGKHVQPEVHGDIHPDEAIMSMAGVRTWDQMIAAHGGNGENGLLEQTRRELDRWRKAAHHPLRTVQLSRFSSNPDRWLRVTLDPVGPGDGDFFTP